jgi:hypothetical protein
MKKRLAPLSLILPLFLTLACLLSPQVATFGPADISTLSAQTLVAIQQQTAALGPLGTSAPPPVEPPPATGEPPASLPTNTPFPTVTTGPTSTSTGTATAKPCNVATAIDVNVPDDWETGPLDHFTKTWRFTNLGSCTWTSGYTLVFDHGDQMDAPASVQVTLGTVPPGGTVDVSVDLLSPAIAGTYRGDFQLKAPDTTLFGHVWVQIKVTSSALPPPAVMPSVSSVYADVSVSPGMTKQASVSCPAGTVAVSGGFSTHRKVQVYSQSLSGNGWRAFGKNTDLVSRNLRVYATCLTYPSTSSTHYWTTGTVTAGDILNLKQACPAGTIVTGGGFSGTSDGSVWTYNSSQSGNGWQTWVKNTSGSNKSVNVYAVCLSGATATTSSSSVTVSIPAHASGGSNYTCPSGKILVGGGWALQEGLTIDSSYFGSDKWYSTLYNSSGDSHIMFLYGVCMALP